MTPQGDALAGGDGAVDRRVLPTAPAAECPHCSAALVGFARVCRACGRPVPADASPAPSPIPDTRSEEEIRVAIKEALETMGYVVVDFEQGYRPDGSTRVRRGVADLFVMGYARCAWLEVKTAKGKQSAHQKAFEADCRRCGITYLIVRNEDDAIAWGRERMGEFAGAMNGMEVRS